MESVLVSGGPAPCRGAGRPFDAAEAGAFFFQATVDGAWRQVQAVGDVVQAQRVRQPAAQQVADADNHFPVTSVEHGDLCPARRRGKVERGFVAPQGRSSRLCVEAGDQRPDAAGDRRGKAGIGGEDQP